MYDEVVEATTVLPLPVVREGDVARSGFLAASRLPLHHTHRTPATPIAGHQLGAPHLRHREIDRKRGRERERLRGRGRGRGEERERWESMIGGPHLFYKKYRLDCHAHVT